MKTRGVSPSALDSQQNNFSRKTIAIQTWTVASKSLSGKKQLL